MNRLPPSSPWRLPSALAALSLAAACASPGGGTVPQAPGGGYGTPLPGAPGVDPGAAPRPGTPQAPAPAPTPLAMEQRFLEDWFRGTPVVIAAQPPTTLQLDVPLAHSFDAGKADIKPALNAVLDRVAQSLLRHAGARITVVAPADSAAALALATTRAERVRDKLGTRGISATRITLVESTRPGTPVQLRLSMPAVSSQQPLARRAEGGRGGGTTAASSSSGGGVQPVSTQRAVPTWTERR